MAQQLLNKLQNGYIRTAKSRVYGKDNGDFRFPETGDFRSRINGADGSVNKLRLASQYWDRVLDLMADNKWLKERSKFYQMTSRLLNRELLSLTIRWARVVKAYCSFICPEARLRISSGNSQ